MIGRRPNARRALVTGGAGFIGSHLVDALTARGDAVAVLDDLSSGSVGNLPDGVQFIEADVSDDRVADLIASWRPDIVFHLAAQTSVPRSVADPERDFAVNCTGTANVIDGARHADARRLVFVSSGGAIYGEARMATEDTPAAPESPYGESKLAAEKLVRESGLDWAIARPSNVYGARQRTDLEGGVVAIFIAALLERRPVVIHSSGRQTRDFVHVSDVVSAMLTMAQAPRAGTWNVATGVSTSVEQLLDELQSQLEPAASTERRPARPGDVFESSLSNARIASELEWTPRQSLRSGLALTLESTLRVAAR